MNKLTTLSLVALLSVSAAAIRAEEAPEIKKPGQEVTTETSAAQQPDEEILPTTSTPETK